MKRLIVMLCFMLTACSGASSADVVAGKAEALDGDTLSIKATVVRLFGIDAPEFDQRCKRPSGVQWACGKAAARKLRQLIAGRRVTCRGSGYDDYDRLIATCTTDNENEINEDMVARGLAVAYRRYSSRYISIEKHARDARSGIWSTEFEAPSLYRKRAWHQATSAPSHRKCPIKGNINRRGERIYHTPWSKVYQKTRINEKKRRAVVLQ